MMSLSKICMLNPYPQGRLYKEMEPLGGDEVTRAVLSEWKELVSFLKTILSTTHPPTVETEKAPSLSLSKDTGSIAL